MATISATLAVVRNRNEKSVYLQAVPGGNNSVGNVLHISFPAGLFAQARVKIVTVLTINVSSAVTVADTYASLLLMDSTTGFTSPHMATPVGLLWVTDAAALSWIATWYPELLVRGTDILRIAVPEPDSNGVPTGDYQIDVLLEEIED